MNFIRKTVLALVIATTSSVAIAGETVHPIKEVFEPARIFSESQSWKVAVVQWNPGENSVRDVTEATGKRALQRNQTEMETRIREAAAAGAKFIVLSEFALTGYPITSELKDPETENYENPEQVWPYAETIPGDSTRFFGKLAKDLGVWIQYGLAERAAIKGKKGIYNSVVVVSDKGQIVATHRKWSLFRVEVNYVTPGTTAQVFDTPVGKMGLLICADVYDSRLLSLYRSQGVQVLSLSTSWAQMNTGMGYFQRAARSTNSYLLAANQTYYPDSGVVNPDGKTQSHIRQSGDAIAYGYLPLVKRTNKKPLPREKMTASQN
ncbi:MAG: carbon-nitrogen hydrolase family protein [Proteobacteria bacterium]|nr:carbon-nitrogen hydrolase family protein [Pseudomonadota bacterium]